MADFDISGLNELVVDLSTASATVGAKVRTVVQKGAANVKQDWQRRASGLSHAPLYPASITYETRIKGMAIEGLIGPDKDLPQGALGNLITYGSVNNPPSGDDVAVANTERPKFEKAIEDIAKL